MTGIFDGHCHVASSRFIPRRFVEDVASNLCCRLGAMNAAPSHGRVVAGLAAQHEDHLADGLVSEMDAAGVERAVLLVPDFGLRMEGTATPEERRPGTTTRSGCATPDASGSTSASTRAGVPRASAPSSGWSTPTAWTA
ncbi:hypothetical protein RB200_22145 [Streptomyces sp. PmtG]